MGGWPANCTTGRTPTELRTWNFDAKVRGQNGRSSGDSFRRTYRRFHDAAASPHGMGSSQEKPRQDPQKRGSDGEIGEGGIRTRETGVNPSDGLANRWFQPLTHLSSHLQTSAFVGSGPAHGQQRRDTRYTSSSAGPILRMCLGYGQHATKTGVTIALLPIASAAESIDV